MLVEKQKFILRAGLGSNSLNGMTDPKITELYDQVVKVETINSKGESVEADEAKLSIFKEYKKQQLIESFPYMW